MTLYSSSAFTAPGTSAVVYLRLDVTASQSATDKSLNRSLVSVNCYMDKPASAGFPSRAFNDCDAAVAADGSMYSATNLNYDFPNAPATISVYSGTKYVTHLADGTKSIAVSASYNGYDPLGTASLSATYVLPAIARAGAEYWNGSAWGDQFVEHWNGSAWVLQAVEHWDGSAWDRQG